MDELLQEFIAETRETLAAIAGEIVAWEADPADRARLDAIFRFVHTVKGSCGFLDLPRLAKLSHEAETVLAAVRDGHRIPDVGLVDAVLAIIDRIGELTVALETGVELAEGDDAELILALEEAPDSALAEPDIRTAPNPVRGTPVGRTVQRSVRLPVELLDRVMNGMSEMVLARNELARHLRDGEPDPATEATLERLSLSVADLRETVSRTRMQAIGALFSALPRVVRDTGSQLEKQVALTIEGSEVELDRELIEAMRDPLIHIVRNAIDHGIEPADVRVAVGKPATGSVTVRAHQAGNTIVIEVADDGAGIDTGRLVAKLADATGRHQSEYDGLSETARAELVFEPGLSSRDEVTEISGRGVGMDVVRANVEQIGGRIVLTNAPGRGLTIAMHVPLTLSILPAIIVRAGDQHYAIARQAIEEIVAADCDTVRIHALGDGAVVSVRGDRMPVAGLSRTMGTPVGAGSAAGLLAVVGVPGGKYALRIDEVADLQELVVRPAAPQIMACGLYAGQTLPDTGVPMLVLHAAGLAEANGITFDRRVAIELESEAAEVIDLVTMLFVRDLDGMRRAVPLSAVERIEQVDTALLAMIGGRLRLCSGDRVVDIEARAALPGSDTTTLVRLCGGDRAIAVAEVIEVADVPSGWADAVGSVGLLGVAMYDGVAVEVIDPSAVEGRTIPAGSNDGERPVCVLVGDAQRWMTDFLAPSLERAGYQVAVEPPPDGQMTILALEGEEVKIPAGGTLIRLDERPGGAGIYRYDRAALLAALSRRVG